MLRHFFHRYTNCSLIKYMEKHKVKPDSKAFHLVSFNKSVQYNFDLSACFTLTPIFS